jgi:ubiquitin-protein ligase
MRRYHYQLGAKFKTPWTIRLDRELKDLQALENDSTILEMKAEGDPPDHYVFTFHGKSLVPGRDENGVSIGDEQKVEIRLGTNYPRRAPEIHWLTPIVHPNISGHNVCLGKFGQNWNPNIRLADVVEILWDMARLSIFNPHSAYRDWGGLDKRYEFPVDKRPLRDKRFPDNVGSSELRPSGGANDVVILDDDESACQFLE